MTTDVYTETVSYFIFRSIITIISAAISIAICTIHYIEYTGNGNKFDRPILKKQAKSKKHNPYSRLLPNIIHILTWMTIISFSSVCIVFALFTIIDQVAQASNILCDLFSNRVMASIVQLGAGCMHCLFIIRLHSIYKGTQFSYNPLILKIFSIIVIICTALSCILLLLYVDVENYAVNLWGSTHNSCNTVVPPFLAAIIGSTEIFVTITMSYLYISRLHKIIKLYISISPSNVHNNVTKPNKLIIIAAKMTILSVIALITTLITAMIIGLNDSAWAAFIDMPINCICLMLMTSYYPNGYKVICCVFIKLMDEYQRRQKINTSMPLKYELTYHMKNINKTDQQDIKHQTNTDNNKQEHSYNLISNDSKSNNDTERVQVIPREDVERTIKNVVTAGNANMRSAKIVELKHMDRLNNKNSDNVIFEHAKQTKNDNITKLSLKEIHNQQPTDPKNTKYKYSSSDELGYVTKHKMLGLESLLNEIINIENNDESASSTVFDVPLIQEIVRNENEYRQYIKQHPQRNSRSGRQGRYHENKRNQNNQQNNRSNNNGGNNNDNHPNDQSGNDGNNNNDNNNDNNDDEKKGNNNDGVYGEEQIAIILEKCDLLKKHRKYKIMQQRNKPLSDHELIALIYYTDSSSACHKMKESHRALANVRKWKELYCHATNGADKMHQVFHLKNDDQQIIPRLYHGSTLESFDKLSQEQVFLKTLFSFSTQFAVAKCFGTGSIWIVDNVYVGLYSGQLKGADVTWISKWDEAEVIVLPTTFYNWKEMKSNDIMRTQNKWIVSSDVTIYITKEYMSNKNPLCVHGDIALPQKDPEYNDPLKPVKDWFDDVGFLEKDVVKYYNIFIQNGYDTLEEIAEMEETDIKEINITKKGHIKKLLRAINKLQPITPSVSNGPIDAQSITNSSH